MSSPAAEHPWPRSHAHAHAHPHATRDALARIHAHQAKLAKHHARLAQLLRAVEGQVRSGALDPATARVSLLQLENYVALVELALDRVRIQGEMILGLGVVGRWSASGIDADARRPSCDAPGALMRRDERALRGRKLSCHC